MFRNKSKLFIPNRIPEVFKRFYIQVENNVQLLTQYFGISENKAEQYVKVERLGKIPPEELLETINFCTDVGFSKKSILKNAGILRYHVSSADQFYTVLKEGGFEPVTPATLLKYRTLYRLSIDTLKSKGFILSKTDVAASFISHLNPLPENFNVNTNDTQIWSDVHYQIFCKYLVWRLQCTPNEVENLMNIHKTVKRKSFKYICENIAIAEDMGFTPVKILRNGYILRNYPKHTREIIEKYPTIVGIPIKQAMKMYPKLLSSRVSNIKKIYDILKKHHIPDHSIARRINVLYLNPKTVEERLQELERIEDFQVLKPNPSILKLVVHHNRAKTRLDMLKELRLKCASTSILGNEDSIFDVHIKEGKDVNMRSDIFAFCKKIFHDKFRESLATLRKHPFYLQVPLITMKTTYQYLKEENFDDSSIIQVSYLLLYSKEKIQTALDQTNQHEKNIGAQFSQLTKLHFVVYFIEKEYHFTGDGVWMKTELIEEENVL